MPIFPNLKPRCQFAVSIPYQLNDCVVNSMGGCSALLRLRGVVRWRILLWSLVNYLQFAHLTLRAGARKPSCFYRCPCLWFHTCMYVSNSCEDGIIHTPCYAFKTSRLGNVDRFKFLQCKPARRLFLLKFSNNFIFLILKLKISVYRIVYNFKYVSHLKLFEKIFSNNVLTSVQ